MAQVFFAKLCGVRGSIFLCVDVQTKPHRLGYNRVASVRVATDPSTEGSRMSRPAHSPTRTAKNLAHGVRTLVTSERPVSAADSLFHDASTNTTPAPLAKTPPQDTRSDVAIEDWNDLLSAVEARLRLIADTLLNINPEQGLLDPADRVRAGVLECVSALDQLHTTMANDAGRRQQLELDIFDAQTALAQSHVELAGTQAEERRARHLAQHDSLTALPNRSYFRERLDRALTEAEHRREPLAVLYLDLDGFKPINDAHGHDAGDELLRIVAARLSRAVRAEDMVSRLGGDEFACLLSGLPNRVQLIHLARKLFDAVSAPLTVGTLKLSVRPSIGIATCPADGDTAEALLKHADAAMYRAKRQQTGHAFFDELADAWAHETK